MLSRAIQNRTGHRLFGHLLITALVLAMLSLAIPAARASDPPADDAKTEEPEEPAVPEIPETVVVPDPVSLTIVLRKSGAIRQIVFNIWLEGTSRQAAGLIEQRLPKVINAFLVDLQRLMYRDTEQRYESREPGKRSFKYVGPDLLPPPPPKTEEELAAEAAAAAEAEEKGEELVKEPPFSPFQPAGNRYFAALQNKLLRTGQNVLPPDTLRSVQIRMFYDFWPGDAKPR
ncbi:hypothetical protein UF64_16390 [Thalassospira sp. HJ]|uniref:hypothetical protein n=1 Tax=Thalassospira sp. HJ TaxID=1616823 RepID=UPI0005CE8E65|nr:hypothetical protein [Thalassospira sp. HJ]KJE34012.1 hypothetical protein UF64_16390 [Thalassospira sp. HJ]